MSVTSGFFDYKLVDNVPDRSYNSDELSRIFEGIITPGVFMHVGNRLEVVVGEGMMVRVRSGRCWFDNKWVNNDADLPLNIGGTTAAGRKDTVVVELNLDPVSVEGRWASIKVIRGTESAIIPPVNTATIKQYILATINVPPNTTQSLTQAMIVSNVGVGGQYPVNWIGTPLTGFSATYYYQHWQQEFDDWFGNAPFNNGIKQTWNTWFTNTQNAWTSWFNSTKEAWSTWFTNTKNAWTTWFDATKGEWNTWFANTQSAWTTWFNATKDAWTTWFNSTKTAWTTYLAEKESEWTTYLAQKESEWSAYLALKGSEWTAYLDAKTASFTTWFNTVKGQVAGDLGAKLTLAVLGGVDYTLDSDSWVAVGTGGIIDYYKYTISIQALTPDARVDVSLNLDRDDFDYAKDAVKNYSYIYSGEFNSSRTELYLYARSLPVVDLKIQIGGVMLNE